MLEDENKAEFGRTIYLLDTNARHQVQVDSDRDGNYVFEYKIVDKENNLISGNGKDIESYTESIKKFLIEVMEG